MKVRVKFRKYGVMKFIGHLDIMRYFQKAIRRAEIDICYSEGFNPHMIMSFASPLGVGLTSDGEYFDIEIGQALSSKDAVERLNKAMVAGMEVMSFRRIAETKDQKAMSLVAAADYEVRFREDAQMPENFRESWEAFLKEEHMSIVKKTKKSDREVDLRPLIYDAKCKEDDTIFLSLCAGSIENIKPELVMEAFGNFMGIEFPEYTFEIHRKELYAKVIENDVAKFVSLEDLGEEF